MVARRPSIRIKGKKIDVRWRPEAGPGRQVYIPFDRPDGIDKIEDALEVPLVRRAFDVISAAECNITKEVALAAIFRVALSEVQLVMNEQKDSQLIRSIPTVNAFVAPYMKHISADDRTTSGTRERYQKHLELAWLPVIGGYRLDQVTPKMIDDVMDSMSVCGCTPGEMGFWCARRVANQKKGPSDTHEPGIMKTTRDKYYAAISGLFTYAVTCGYRSDSPVARSVYKPRPLSQYSAASRKKHFYLTEAQFELLRSKMPESTQLMFRLWGETGMRFSEITGLVPDQLKCINGVVGIDLNESVKYSKEKKYYRGLPKNKSARFIHLDTETFELLVKCAEKVKTGKDLLFTTPTGHRIVANNFKRDVWDPAVAAAMRCPQHPPTGQAESAKEADLAGPKCGDNGGLNARGKPCGFRVQAGSNRCYAHQGLPRRAVSDCACAELDPPLRLPRRLTPHDLRHTYNSWMQSWGIHAYQMARRIGNSVMVNNAIYGGSPEKAEIELARRSVRTTSTARGSS